MICDDRELIFDETPEADKSIDTVIDALQSAGLIKVMTRLKPVQTCQTREI